MPTPDTDRIDAVRNAVHDVDRLEDIIAKAQAELKEARERLAGLIGSARPETHEVQKAARTDEFQASLLPTLREHLEAGREESLQDRVWAMLVESPRIDYTEAANRIYGAAGRSETNRIGALLTALRRKNRVRAEGNGVWIPLDELGQPVPTQRRAV
jgi:hypothetical protein